MSMTLVGRAKCGCIRVAVVDSGRPEVRRIIADALRRGYTIERLDTSAVRAQSWQCDSDFCPYRRRVAQPTLGGL